MEPHTLNPSEDSNSSSASYLYPSGIYLPVFQADNSKPGNASINGAFFYALLLRLATGGVVTRVTRSKAPPWNALLSWLCRIHPPASLPPALQVGGEGQNALNFHLVHLRHLNSGEPSYDRNSLGIGMRLRAASRTRCGRAAKAVRCLLYTSDAADE